MMTTSRRFQMTSQRKRGQQQEMQWEKGELSSSGAGGSTRRTLSTASKNNREREREWDWAWHFQLIKVLRLQLTESFDPDGAA